MKEAASFPMPSLAPSLKQAEYLSPHQQAFRFPQGASLGQTFHTLQDVGLFLNLQSLKQNRYVRYCFRETLENDKVEIACCQCSSLMVLQRLPSKQWEVKELKSEHLAVARTSKTTKYELAMDYLHKLNELDNITGVNRPCTRTEEMEKQFDVSAWEFNELKNVYVDRLHNNFELLREKMGSYQIEANAQICRDNTYPEVILVHSKKMKDTYDRFAQCLYFKVVPARISDTAKYGSAYRMGVFFVRDHAMRIILVGCVFFKGNDTNHLLQAFQLFFKHQNSHIPETVVTNNDEELIGVIAQLNFLKCIKVRHLFDPYVSAARIKKERQNNFQHTFKYLKLAVESHNQETFEAAIGKLEAESPSQQLTKFIQCSSKMCFCALPQTFCGVWEFFDSVPNFGKVIKPIIKKGHTIAEKVEVFAKVDALLQKKQEIGSETQIFVDYEDPRVTTLSLSLEPCIMDIFLKKYAKSRQWSAFPTPEGFELVNSSNECRRIVDLKCDCSFTVKTGIPCEHVISCVTILPDVDFCSLFQRRWLRSYRAKSTIDLTES